MRLGGHRLLQAPPEKGLGEALKTDGSSTRGYGLELTRFRRQVSAFVTSTDASERRNARYYVGLLSAAQYHGAAHHRPQELQVVLERNRPAIACGSVRVAFIARRNLVAVPVASFNNPRGTVVVSTVEATAVDLVGYVHRAGGVDRVAGVLSELGEDMDPERLVEASRTASILWAQRLGYLLEHVGAADKAVLLKEHVRKGTRNSTKLLPGASAESAPRSKDWRLYVNASIDTEA